jgi:choloylglycine hydrolase
MLDAVSIPRGVCDIGEGHYHHTLYSSCINASRGIYYCTTYDNRRIAAARLERTGERLRRYPIFRQMEIDSLKEVML